VSNFLPLLHLIEISLEEGAITLYLIIVWHCQGHEYDDSVMDFSFVVLSFFCYR
jgi:hypothetical protein